MVQKKPRTKDHPVHPVHVRCADCWLDKFRPTGDGCDIILPLLSGNCVLQEWQDERLTWDPVDFGNLTDIIVRADKLWLPELAVMNGSVHLSASYRHLSATWVALLLNLLTVALIVNSHFIINYTGRTERATRNFGGNWRGASAEATKKKKIGLARTHRKEMTTALPSSCNCTVVNTRKPQRRRRPRNTWIKDLEKEIWMPGFNYRYRKMEAAAQNKAGWSVACAKKHI